MLVSRWRLENDEIYFMKYNMIQSPRQNMFCMINSLRSGICSSLEHGNADSLRVLFIGNRVCWSRNHVHCGNIQGQQ